MLLRVCPRSGLCWRETACRAGRKGAGTVLWPPSRASMTWVLKSQYLSGHHIFPFLIAYYATSHFTSLNFNYNSERMFCFFNRGLWVHSQRHRWGGFTKKWRAPWVQVLTASSSPRLCLPACPSFSYQVQPEGSPTSSSQEGQHSASSSRSSSPFPAHHQNTSFPTETDRFHCLTPSATDYE